LIIASRRSSFFRTLYFRVLVGIVAGVAVGYFFPRFGASLKPLGDGFLKLIRMLVAPVVFFTVVSGIANVGDLRRLGRVGLKSIFYFEVVTTAALVIGMVATTLMQPGRGTGYARSGAVYCGLFADRHRRLSAEHYSGDLSWCVHPW